jgi:hypothetical protein
MNNPESSGPDMTGTWHITEMEMWDENYINLEQQAYIRIRESGGGDFQFGLVSGVIDGYVETLDSGARFSFTWEGSDEMDPVSGSGWLRPVGDGEAEGMIKFHMGDRSRLSAQRAS